MKRRTLSHLLALLLVLGLTLGLVSAASADGETHSNHCICGASTNVGDHTPHTDVTWTEWTETNKLPETAGNYYLKSDVTLTSRWTVSNNINLCLNGKTITQENNNTGAIYVDTGKSLTITDCQTTVGKITHTAGKTGSAITNNGTFTLWNGSITGNSCGNSGAVKNEYGKSFYMYGGSISGNTGSGVYNSGGTFEMSGGTISNNINGHNGGGVYNTGSGTFRMSGGIITGNRPTQDGGGVYNDASFTMSGGSITGNSAKSGGGVYNFETFTMSGGSITENTAMANGGGVYTYNPIKLSGDVTITGNIKGGTITDGQLSGGTRDNVYLDTSQYIEVDGSMGNNASVGVARSSPGSMPKTVSGTTDTTHFFSDDETYRLVAKPEENALYLEKTTTTPDTGATDTETTPTPDTTPTPTPTPTPTTTRSTSRAYIVIDSAAAAAADTTTTTAAKATAAKTLDAGVGVYAVSAVLSVTGMAWIGKKKH